ncbi:winged helix-turn-helix domain-containing protein [Nitratireductor basaltis]|uniref:winged helix-turn-helix domain-containing protein n=1 Tax=Nitratireductor basaltis TaxID=472175 RepID=UPI0009DEA6B2
MGLRLPSEQDLCRQLAVSRTVVRNAISRLRDDDLVDKIRGSGAFVLECPTSTTSRAHLTKALVSTLKRCRTCSNVRRCAC